MSRKRDQYEHIICTDTVFSSLLYFCYRVGKNLRFGWIFGVVLESPLDIDSIACRNLYISRSRWSSDDLVDIPILPLPLLSIGREAEKKPPTLEHGVGTDIPDESDPIDGFHIVDS